MVYYNNFHAFSMAETILFFLQSPELVGNRERVVCHGNDSEKIAPMSNLRLFLSLTRRFIVAPNVNQFSLE